MALSITTVGDINSAKSKIIAAADKYSMALEKVKKIVIQSEISWNSLQASDNRERIIKSIDNELTDRQEEMLAQAKFLEDTSKVLRESQEEVQNTLS